MTWCTYLHSNVSSSSCAKMKRDGPTEGRTDRQTGGGGGSISPGMGGGRGGSIYPGPGR